MTPPYRGGAINTNLPGCRAHLTAIFNHPGRGFHNCQLLIVNCQFISESAIFSRAGAPVIGGYYTIFSGKSK